MKRRYSLIAFIVILVLLISPSGVQAQESGPASPEATLADDARYLERYWLHDRRSRWTTRQPSFRTVACSLSGATMVVIYLASAEIYDPVAGIWNPTGSLTHRPVQTTRRPCCGMGGCWLSGGNTSGSTLPAPKFMTRMTGTWGFTGSLVTARTCPHSNTSKRWPRARCRGL